MSGWAIVCEVEGKNPAADHEVELPADLGDMPTRPKSRAKKALEKFDKDVKAWEERKRKAEEVERNLGGIIIKLENGSKTHEVARVAFIRRAAKNPDVPFKAQLDKELEKAVAARDAMNKSTEGAGVLQ